MATISIAATGVTTKNFTISAGDTTRLLNWAKLAYGVGTNQAAFDAWATAFMAGTIANIKNIEDQTAKAAVVAPVDIVLT